MAAGHAARFSLRLLWNRKARDEVNTIPLRWTRNEPGRSRGRSNKQQPAAKDLPQFAGIDHRHLPRLAAFCREFDPPNQYPT